MPSHFKLTLLTWTSIFPQPVIIPFILVDCYFTDLVSFFEFWGFCLQDRKHAFGGGGRWVTGRSILINGEILFV